MEPSILRRFVNKTITVISIAGDHAIHGVLQAVDNVMLLVNVDGNLVAVPLATIKVVTIPK